MFPPPPFLFVQVGCKMGCKFCATGSMGFKNNLSSGEIVEQLVHASAFSQIRNVVFMVFIFYLYFCTSHVFLVCRLIYYFLTTGNGRASQQLFCCGGSGSHHDWIAISVVLEKDYRINGKICILVFLTWHARNFTTVKLTQFTPFSVGISLCSESWIGTVQLLCFSVLLLSNFFYKHCWILVISGLWNAWLHP